MQKFLKKLLASLPSAPPFSSCLPSSVWVLAPGLFRYHSLWLTLLLYVSMYYIEQWLSYFIIVLIYSFMATWCVSKQWGYEWDITGENISLTRREAYKSFTNCADLVIPVLGGKYQYVVDTFRGSGPVKGTWEMLVDISGKKTSFPVLCLYNVLGEHCSVLVTEVWFIVGDTWKQMCKWTEIHSIKHINTILFDSLNINVNIKALLHNLFEGFHLSCMQLIVQQATSLR